MLHYPKKSNEWVGMENAKNLQAKPAQQKKTQQTDTVELQVRSGHK